MIQFFQSKSHPYTIATKMNVNEDKFKRLINLFLKYERLFSGEMDGQLPDFYNVVTDESLLSCLNLIYFNSEKRILTNLDLNECNLLEVMETDLASSAKRAAFSVFGWDQVYVEAV